MPVPEIYFLKTDKRLFSSSWHFRWQSEGGETRFQEQEQLREQNIPELALLPLPQAVRFPLPNGSIYASESNLLPLELLGWNACLTQATRVLGHTSLFLPRSWPRSDRSSI